MGYTSFRSREEERGLKTAVRIEESIPTALDEAHERKRMDTLSERPEEFYKTSVLLKNSKGTLSPLNHLAKRIGVV